MTHSPSNAMGSQSGYIRSPSADGGRLSMNNGYYVDDDLQHRSFNPSASVFSPHSHAGQALNTGGGLSFSQQRSRTKNNSLKMKLYVGGDEFNTSIAPSGVSRSPIPGQSSSGVYNAADSGGRGGSPGEQGSQNSGSAILTALADLVNTALSSVSEMIPRAMRTLAKPAAVAFIVFMYFLLVDIVLLVESRKRIAMLFTLRAHDNDQHLSVAIDLTSQLRAKSSKMEKLRTMADHHLSDGTSREDAPLLISEITHLHQLRERSIDQLYVRTGYPGPREDIAFLVDQHVAYTAKMRELAEEELSWAADMLVSRRNYDILHRGGAHVIGFLADDHLRNFSSGKPWGRGLRNYAGGGSSDSQKNARAAEEQGDDAFSGFDNVEDEEEAITTGGIEARSSGSGSYASSMLYGESISGTVEPDMELTFMSVMKNILSSRLAVVLIMIILASAYYHL